MRSSRSSTSTRHLKQARIEQQRSFCKAIRMVEAEQLDSHTGLRTERLETSAIQTKMIDPTIFARMKERDQLTGFRIERGQVTALCLLQSVQDKARLSASVAPPCF